MYKEVEVSDEKYKIMYEATQGEIGKKYDYLELGTGFFMLAPYLQNDDERYCSDICMWLAWLGGIIKKRLWIVSPRVSAKLIPGELKEVT